MKIEVVQMKPKIGQIEVNASKILHFYKTSSANCVLFPELALTGYFPKDELLKTGFVKKVHEEIQKIIPQIKERACVFGTPFFENGLLFNAVLVLQNGKIVAKSFKKYLAKGEIFDEHRYFASGKNTVCNINGICVGLSICEDIWHQETFNEMKKFGVEILLVANASPFEIQKQEKRQQIMKNCDIPLIYCNQVACQDGILYDGSSFAFDGKFHEISSFCEERKIFEFCNQKFQNEKSIQKTTEMERIFNALVFGIREFLNKFHIEKVIIGLSGGADSALVATLCKIAIGGKNVKCVFMPSKFTSKESLEDTNLLAKNLEIPTEVIPIDEMVEVFESSLEMNEIARQNIQARVRGNILMSISNYCGGVVFTTGNKSEIATGYCTIYGDMCGGFNPIKDLYKTQVFQLMNFINEKKIAKIPQQIIEKEPSAELAPNQKDSNTLPVYEMLDGILFQLIEEGKLPEEVESYDAKIVQKVWKLLVNSEYKRWQSAPGIKISSKSFEQSDWRFNI